MVATRNEDALASLRYEADTFRKALSKHGFIDDGTELRGGVEWTHNGEKRSAIVSVSLTERFPFAPPSVSIVDSGALVPTFHRETNGDLCLWTTDHAVESAPWLDVDTFLAKVSGWFEAAENGWPNDHDADLERYLEQDFDTILIYNGDEIKPGIYYRTRTTGDAVVLVTERLRWVPRADRKNRRACVVVKKIYVSLLMRVLLPIQYATGGISLVPPVGTSLKY